jgi:integrase
MCSPWSASFSIGWSPKTFSWFPRAQELKHQDKLESRERVLTDEELKFFWQACDVLGYPFGYVGKLLLLTGQRLREVAGMSADELDLERRQWVIPKERAKNNKAHIVPLSDPAVAVIEELEATPRAYSPRGLLFTTNWGDGGIGLLEG